MTPTLIIQMQRLGDLVLTFPLMLRLLREEPARPVWVVAEQRFFEPLMPLSPPVTFFPPEAADRLATRSYARVINLSHRPEAAVLAARMKGGEHIGPTRTDQGSLYVHGQWQLYRTSLVHNNRYNGLHWADLNMLDLFAPGAETVVQPPPADRGGKKASRVGLFLGASQREKRPNAAFWSRLCSELLDRGCRPVLLGGEQEKEIGQHTARQVPAQVLNLCGRLSLSELAGVLRSLDLLITPDTGPMHLAAWVGTRVLNLALGPVNSWETGPYPAGHWVMMPSLSCTGCWGCAHRELRCRELLHPRHAAYAAARLADGRARLSPSRTAPGAQLWMTGRDRLGLYTLSRTKPPAHPVARDGLRMFWKGVWLWRFGHCAEQRAREGWKTLCAHHPGLIPAFTRSLADFTNTLAAHLKRPASARGSLWTDGTSLVAPLSGYLELFLQNRDYDPRAGKEALEFVEALMGFVGEA